MTHPATPAETLATKIILGHLVTEIALLQERLGRDPMGWTDSLRDRVMNDIAHAHVSGANLLEAHSVLTSARQVSVRFFERVRNGVFQQ